MPERAKALDFARDGAWHVSAALDEAQCCELEAALTEQARDMPGVRIGDASAFSTMLPPDGAIGRIAAEVLGPDAAPVRAILFDKTPDQNWGLGWHQDRTIVVAERIQTAGFGPWTIKAGLVQVEPPFAILDRMVTLRIHLDPVGTTNGPLRILPGSHRLGRLTEAVIDDLAQRIEERTCLAARGDVWLYATPIVHASRPAEPPRRRRVLQIDYTAESLPAPLRWRGV